jgi:protocatechuate 4,5-dioxygenase, alpha chain
MPQSDPPGTYIFDGKMASQGYALSKMAMSLAKSENRAAFKRDENAYLDRYALTPEQRDAIKQRDWLRLVKLGGNIYYLYKLTAIVDPMKMSELGASQAGLAHDEFIKRNEQRGREPWRG